MSNRTLACLACGETAPHGTRCPGCGAEIVGLDVHDRPRESSFDAKVFVLALLVFAALVGAFVVGLPLVVRTYDPQGVPGFLVASGVCFLASLGLGRALGPEAYVEPGLAAVLVGAALVPYMVFTADVRAMPVGYYVAGAVLTGIVASLGSFLGERKGAGA